MMKHVVLFVGLMLLVKAVMSMQQPSYHKLSGCSLPLMIASIDGVQNNALLIKAVDGTMGWFKVTPVTPGDVVCFDIPKVRYDQLK